LLNGGPDTSEKLIALLPSLMWLLITETSRINICMPWIHGFIEMTIRIAAKYASLYPAHERNV
jgi:hypothetical protein